MNTERFSYQINGEEMNNKRSLLDRGHLRIPVMHSTRHSKRTRNRNDATDEQTLKEQEVNYREDEKISDSDSDHSWKSLKFYEKEMSSDSDFPFSHSFCSKFGDIEKDSSLKGILRKNSGDLFPINSQANQSSNEGDEDEDFKTSSLFRIGEIITDNVAESYSANASLNDKIPDDILIQILSRIPGSCWGPSWKVPQQVCTRWRRLIKSPQFFCTRQRLTCTKSWLVTLTCRFSGGLLCKIFDPVSQKCQRMDCSWTALPPSRKFYSFTSMDNEIYVIGGLYQHCKMKSSSSSSSNKEKEQRDEKEDENEDDKEKEDEKEEREKKKENCENRIVTVTDECDVFNPFNDNCRKISPLSFPRSHTACCAGNGRIYVMGGLDKEGKETAIAEAYHPHLNQWTRIADLPEPRHNCIAEFVNGKVYLLRGRYFSEADLEHLLTVHVYDPESDTWRSVARLPIGGPDFKACVMLGRLCVMGGSLHAYQGGLVRCFNLPLVLDEDENEWKIWKQGFVQLSLRSLDGAWHRMTCNHHACIDYLNRPFAIVVLNNEIYLIRRCIDPYCRHIHRFRAELALAGDSLAWECVPRQTKFSNLLREAGDCWQHSVAVVVKA